MKREVEQFTVQTDSVKQILRSAINNGSVVLMQAADQYSHGLRTDGFGNHFPPAFVRLVANLAPVDRDDRSVISKSTFTPGKNLSVRGCGAIGNGNVV